MTDRIICPPDHSHWREVPGFDGAYLASSDGRIWSNRKHRFLKQSVAGAGYLRVGLPVAAGRTTSGYVHRLVCAAFHGEPRDGQEVRHLDGDPTNNRPENLAWGTHQENSDDKVLHGTWRKTHCKRGHEFTPENTGWNPARNGFRICLTCRREHWGKK